LPRVVITLPAYQAERTLAQTVADIPPGVADRLILVDDASPDNTAQLARELGIEVHVHRENLGYGGNQKTCYAEALSTGADIVVLLHPDYQYEPKAVPLLIAPILAGDADMTFGSRFAGLGDPIGGGMPMYRYVGNRLTTIAENLMLGSRFTELHSGLRAYTRRCLLSLPFLRYSNNFLFDSQFLIDAVTSGQRVVEVPIPTRYTKESSSIAIDRSLAYIAGTLTYCARSAAKRGRRGRRSPISSFAAVQVSGGAAQVDAVACPACGEMTEAVVDASPRGGSSLLRCTRCGLVAPVTPAAHEQEPSRMRDSVIQTTAGEMLDVVGAYFAPGDRLLALGPANQIVNALAHERGWRTIEAEGKDQAMPDVQGLPWIGRRDHDHLASAVTLLDCDGSLPDALDDLRRARSALDPEGLLVVATRTGAVSRRSGLPGTASYVLTPRSIQALLTRSGFRSVDWVSSEPGAFGRLRSARDSTVGAIAVARPTSANRDGAKA
jgi:hypothetical protein